MTWLHIIAAAGFSGLLFVVLASILWWLFDNGRAIEAALFYRPESPAARSASQSGDIA